jgi:hypothetical protein
VPDIELDLEWDNSYDPGRYSVRPEDCYPAEEDWEIMPTEGWKHKVLAAYTEHAMKAIEEIETRLDALNDGDFARQWAEDARQSADEAYAEFLYERQREDRL